LRVAYVVNQYPRSTHTFIRTEIRALEAEGHEVRRFSMRATVAPSDLADRDELALTRSILGKGLLPLFAALAWTWLAHPVRTLRALVLAMRVARRADRGLLVHLAYLAEASVLLRWTRDVDWVHAHFGNNSATVAMLLHELGGPGFSFTVHGTAEFDRPETLSLEDKIGRAGFAVAVSDFGRAQMYRWVPPALWSRIHVVHCAVGQDFLAVPPTAPPADRRLVCVARLGAEKGHLVLLEAAARLASRGERFQLTLVGDGPMRPAVEAFIQRSGLSNHVRLAGWLSPGEVREEILRSRCLVQPSFAEGLPVSILEAFALGRPVIATAIAGIPEIVKDGRDGWLVPASNVEELTRCMAEALSADPLDLERMGRDGALRVAQHYDAQGQARRLAEFFAQYAGAPSSRAVRAPATSPGLP